mmetsp:Transcript_36105/g.81286  ORF Transcript_36105/g.81286 Transcript_36105/m.81286 type:complete len:200 (+) Transcript_36105:110-709(+)
MRVETRSPPQTSTPPGRSSTRTSLPTRRSQQDKPGNSLPAGKSARHTQPRRSTGRSKCFLGCSSSSGGRGCSLWPRAGPSTSPPHTSRRSCWSGSPPPSCTPAGTGTQRSRECWSRPMTCHIPRARARTRRCRHSRSRSSCARSPRRRGRRRSRQCCCMRRSSRRRAPPRTRSGQHTTPQQRTMVQLDAASPRRRSSWT